MMDKSCDQIENADVEYPMNFNIQHRYLNGRRIPLNRMKLIPAGNRYCPAECTRRASSMLKFLERTMLDTPAYSNKKYELIDTFSNLRDQALQNLTDIHAVLQDICLMDRNTKRALKLNQKRPKPNKVLETVNCTIASPHTINSQNDNRVIAFNSDLSSDLTDTSSDTSDDIEIIRVTREIPQLKLENGVLRHANMIKVERPIKASNVIIPQFILPKPEPLSPEINMSNLEEVSPLQSDVEYIKFTPILNDLNMYEAKEKTSQAVVITLPDDSMEDCDIYAKDVLSYLNDNPLTELTIKELETELGVLTTVQPVEDNMHKVIMQSLSPEQEVNQ